MNNAKRAALWRASIAATGLAMIVPPLYAKGVYGDPLPDGPFRFLLVAAGLSLVSRMGAFNAVASGARTGWNLPFVSMASGLLLAASFLFLRHDPILFIGCAVAAVLSVCLDSAISVGSPDGPEIARNENERGALADAEDFEAEMSEGFDPEGDLHHPDGIRPPDEALRTPSEQERIDRAVELIVNILDDDWVEARKREAERDTADQSISMELQTLVTTLCEVRASKRHPRLLECFGAAYGQLYQRMKTQFEEEASRLAGLFQLAEFVRENQIDQSEAARLVGLHELARADCGDNAQQLLSSYKALLLRKHEKPEVAEGGALS